MIKRVGYREKVVWRGTRSAVKQRDVLSHGVVEETFYDVWVWDLKAMRWRRENGNDCWGSLEDARCQAVGRDREIQALLDRNREAPPPL